MTITRSFCPLCDWHHDQDDAVEVPPAVTVDAEILASGDLVAMAGAVAHQTLVARLGDAEDAIRAHLETHKLIEWVTALTAAQRRIVELEQQAARSVDGDAKELTLPQVMAFHNLTGRIIDQAQSERWEKAGRCGTCGHDGDRNGCQDCHGVDTPAMQAGDVDG